MTVTVASLLRLRYEAQKKQKRKDRDQEREEAMQQWKKFSCHATQVGADRCVCLGASCHHSATTSSCSGNVKDPKLQLRHLSKGVRGACAGPS